jgi:hypothetical protein
VLTRRIPRPSVALVVAFVALFAALGGTGYAALKITGKEIANETITGADVDDKSLRGKELRGNTLGGDQIKESALGTVPEAAHAANADTAINAQTAAKASDADTVGGIPAAQLMTVKPRGYETNIGQDQNFASGSPLATLADLPPGTYLVTAKLSYYNAGASDFESCTLDVPGANDVTDFTVESGDTVAVTMQEITTSESQFGPFVHCTSDGDDDLEGVGSIIAVRLD